METQLAPAATAPRFNLGSGEGPTTARILIVGEAWGEREEASGLPFQGPSGQELNAMLSAAGIGRHECYTTNVVNARPAGNDIGQWITWKRKDVTADHKPFRDGWVRPMFLAGLDRLETEIELIAPNIIIALGNTPLWALTGERGVMKWRASQLTTVVRGRQYKVIPTLHPAYVLRDYEWRPAVIKDLERAGRERHSNTYTNVPSWNFSVPELLESVLETLRRLTVQLDAGVEVWLDFDIETAAGHIDCVGISWSKTEALVIPLMSRESTSGYWSEESEAEIVYALYVLLTHPKAKVRWQNGLYDAQYTYRHWHFVPRGAQDTMLSQHVMFLGAPKSLDYQASLYADHYVYWKAEGKVVDMKVPERQRWIYNGKDCVYTREVGEVEAAMIPALGLVEQEAFQQAMFWPVLRCMQRGVAIDKKHRAKLANELLTEIGKCEAWFHFVLGHTLNPNSRTQMLQLFYTDFGERAIFPRKKKAGKPSGPTLGKEALQTIWLRTPLLRPFIDKVREYRSLQIFMKNFVMAKLDIDDRMRTSYNIAGTKTLRLASRKNAFGSGTNLQNVPKGDEASEAEEDDDDEVDSEEMADTTGLRLPNIRKIFVPDPGYEIFDLDLSKADLRIVTWEADEPEMKAWLAAGKDPYIEIAREYYKDPGINKYRADGTDDPKYKTFKSFAHGTHYLGTPFGLAGRIGLSVHETERAQRWYFGRMPKIRQWQIRFCDDLRRTRQVHNAFGYRRFYTGRIDDATCREAIAWVPQSTVALYINKIWKRLDDEHRHIWILLQVHDSLVGQYPLHRRAECLAQIAEAGKIVLPYAEPLIIPTGVKTSSVSWGDC